MDPFAEHRDAEIVQALRRAQSAQGPKRSCAPDQRSEEKSERSEEMPLNGRTQAPG